MLKSVALYLLIPFSIMTHNGFSQQKEDRILYIVDSVEVKTDPEEGNDILPEQIADLKVVKDKNSLRKAGYEDFDGVIYIFTKEYKKRPEDIKKIPTTHNMQRKDGVWHYKDRPYTGHFIDYYYSGIKQGEGNLEQGIINGKRLRYSKDGDLQWENNYKNGKNDGAEKKYYKDGVLNQEGIYVNGKMEGIWSIYYPNKKIKQKASFHNGEQSGETVMYRSSGEIIGIVKYVSGKPLLDDHLKSLDLYMKKGNKNNIDQDYKSAIKAYSKALEVDSGYAEAYFARGTSKLNDFQFEEAFKDFSKAIAIEPFYEEALANRAFTLIRKKEFSGSRKIKETNGVQILATNAKIVFSESEKSAVCNDLMQAIYLGDKNKIASDAFQKYCKKKPVEN